MEHGRPRPDDRASARPVGEEIPSPRPVGEEIPSPPPPMDGTEQRRRIGLMQRITEGLPSCVEQELVALYRLIRNVQPPVPHTKNANGVFVPLNNLTTSVLEDCFRLIQHGLAQDRKERGRLQMQHNFLKDLT